MMNRLEVIKRIRNKLARGEVSIGSWMQLSDSSVAEIMGESGYDWVAVDQEHGSISVSQLPDIFRSLELGNTLPLVRISEAMAKDCKQALDAGAGGIIVPMVESAEQLEIIKNACRWPPSGRRSVGFSRANLFGKKFEEYIDEAQEPILVAMIESIKAVENLESILKVEGLDAILLGPYDLSASMGITGQFSNTKFVDLINNICLLSDEYSVSYGIHQVTPSQKELLNKIEEGFRFIAYSIDSSFLSKNCENPLK